MEKSNLSSSKIKGSGKRRTPSLSSFIFLAFSTCSLFTIPAVGQCPSTPLVASSGDELNDYINQVNGCNSGDTAIIALTKSFTLDQDILPINTLATLHIQPDSNQSVDIDGAQQYRGFVILNGTVILENINIKNMQSMGGFGCMGAGAGLFVAKTNIYQPSVTLININFAGCTSKGGSILGPPQWLDLPAGGFSGAGGSYHEDGQWGGAGCQFGAPFSKDVFGNFAQAGCFGILGSSGAGGTGGGPGNATPPGPGGPGGQGSPSGYGAGSSAGGGGGGGGGGCGQAEAKWGLGYDTTAQDGAGSGAGGDSGSFGFGGTPASSPFEGGQPGSPRDGGHGGNGAQGGMGAMPSGGAGFGGAVFAMGNADVTFTGTGTISGNSVTGGGAWKSSVCATAAGAGIFLQGSGTLKFKLENSQDTYTISDELCDERGAVKSGKATLVPITYGSDGLPRGGGQGAWGIDKEGSGTLNITGGNLLSGDININGGTLDLSNCPNIDSDNLKFEENTKLVHQPSSDTTGTLKLQTLTISESTILCFNGYTKISAGTVNFPSQFSIIIDSAGFPSSMAITALSWDTPITSLPSVTVNSGYTCTVGPNTIMLQKEP